MSQIQSLNKLNNINIPLQILSNNPKKSNNDKKTNYEKYIQNKNFDFDFILNSFNFIFNFYNNMSRMYIISDIFYDIHLHYTYTREYEFYKKYTSNNSYNYSYDYYILLVIFNKKINLKDLPNIIEFLKKQNIIEKKQDVIKKLNIDNPPYKLQIGDVISNKYGPIFLSNKAHNEIIFHIYCINEIYYYMTISSTMQGIMIRTYTNTDTNIKNKNTIYVCRYTENNNIIIGPNYDTYIYCLLSIIYYIIQNYFDINDKKIKFSTIAINIFNNCYTNVNIDSSYELAYKFLNTLKIDNDIKMNVLCSTFVGYIVNLAIHMSYKLDNQYNNKLLYLLNPIGCTPYNLVDSKNKLCYAFKTELYFYKEINYKTLISLFEKINI